MLRLRPPEATGGPPQTINKEGEWPVFVFLFVFHYVFVFLLVSEFEDGLQDILHSALPPIGKRMSNAGR